MREKTRLRGVEEIGETKRRKIKRQDVKKRNEEKKRCLPKHEEKRREEKSLKKQRDYEQPKGFSELLMSMTGTLIMNHTEP